MLTDFSGYSKLTHPSLSPSPLIFTLVWSALYVFMGTASYLFWRDTQRFSQKKAEPGLVYYFITLIAAFIWPVLFFNLNLRLLAGAWLLLMIWLSSVTTVKFFKVNRTAGYLFIPMLAWLLFSLYLNVGFIIAN